MSNLVVQPIKVTKGTLVISDADVKIIDSAYQPAIDKMLELAPKVVKVIEMEDGDEKTKLAKDLYGKYVKIRTTTKKDIHTPTKAKFSAQVKYCDLHNRTRDEIGGPIEAKLKEIKDAAKIAKDKEVEELRIFREQQIEPFLEDTAQMIPGLGEMNEIVWANLLQGTKSTYELNKKTTQESSAEAQKQAAYQAETMRRYNLLMPLQKFVTEDNKKNYASLATADFDAILLEAQTLSNKADQEVIELKQKNAELEQKVETVVAEKETVVAEKEAIVQENVRKDFNETIQAKLKAGREGATDKEKMEAYVLDLETVMERYTFTDPKFTNVLVQSNNYIVSLINNIKSFNV